MEKNIQTNVLTVKKYMRIALHLPFINAVVRY